MLIFSANIIKTNQTTIFMVTVNRSQLDRKLLLIQERFDKLLSFLVRDAAVFLQEKVKDEVLNGETGTDYPKSYPGSISKGAKGFVGVVSGQLRNAIDIDVTEISKHESSVFLNGSLAAIGVNSAGYSNYGEIMAVWAKHKYGENYFEIAISLYGTFVNEKFIESIKEFFRQVNANQNPTYKNPFP